MSDLPTCVVLGNSDIAEMRPVRDWLAAAPLDFVDDPATADLVVVQLDHPDEFPGHEVDRLLAAASLARWVVCRSTWCESLGRTRDAWPFATLVAARLAPARLDAELAVIRGDRAPLPLTASRDETWEFDHVPVSPVSPIGGHGCILVVSPDRPLAESWAATLRDAGFDVVFEAAATPIDAVLLDGDPFGDPFGDRTSADIDELRANGHDRLVVALTMPAATIAEDPRFSGVEFVAKLAPSARLAAAFANSTG